MRRGLSFFVFLLPFFSNAQRPATRAWAATLRREDGVLIPFSFQLDEKAKRMFVSNAAERLQVDSLRFYDDSVTVKMPVFESTFLAEKKGDSMQGVWLKGAAGKPLVLPFSATAGSSRFTLTNGKALQQVTGRWAVRFGGNETKPNSIAELSQKGNRVTGTILTPTGDYRYLEGVVTGKELKLSCFDGAHAFLFTADITDAQHLDNGTFYSGPVYKQQWSAVKNAKATVSQDEAAMYLKPGEERLTFLFPDLEGKQVSINDARFQNKVVVVQLMGSWCPNCMDETAFLSEYYNHNRQRGVEMVALAYELSTDFERSVASIQKFQKRFNVQYPMLVTGVTVSDPQRTEKTLPQVTPIKVFPTSIILDKKGRVRKLDYGFYGPGTGEHYAKYKKEFENTIIGLLNEN